MAEEAPATSAAMSPASADASAPSCEARKWTSWWMGCRKSQVDDGTMGRWDDGMMGYVLYVDAL